MTVQVENLSKTFADNVRGELTAVDDISFEVKEGVVLGLLGLNGAGKTTTLRIICTLLKPSGGSVKVNGYDVLKDADLVRGHIGYLPADTNLTRNVSPRELLRFFGQLCKYPRERLNKRVEEVIELLELGAFADRYCQHLSTGNKRKVALARAIVHDPPVLILDEPTTNLDVVTAVKVRELLRSFKVRNKCVILSTHNMTEAEKVCDEIAIIHGGKIMATATPDVLRSEKGDQDLEDIFISIAGQSAV